MDWSKTLSSARRVVGREFGLDNNMEKGDWKNLDNQCGAFEQSSKSAGRKLDNPCEESVWRIGVRL